MAVSENILIKVSAFVKDQLTEKLPAGAFYHNLDHTMDVVEAVKTIATAEGVGKENQNLLLVAAWFHDTGHIYGTKDHEEKSITIATDFLVREKIDPSDLMIISGCINATKLPQKPTNHLEEILCDADLHHLSDNTFTEKSNLLRQEWEEGQRIYNEQEWLELNMDFLGRHLFFTNYAKNNMKEGKTRNKMIILDKIEGKKKQN